MDAHILARLHLHAVLPGLSDLFASRSDWRAATHDWDWTLVVGLPGSTATTLRFRGGELEVRNAAESGASFRIWLASPRQVNALFSGSGLAVPLPWGNPMRLGRVRLFARMADQMGALLQNKIAEHRPQRYERARLLFRTLLRGAAVIGPSDAGLSGCAAGTVVFLLADGTPLGALTMDGTSIVFRDGAPQHWDARVTFADSEALTRVVDEELDALAAAGCGQVGVEGLVPLADAASLVMEKVGEYLRPR